MGKWDKEIDYETIYGILLRRIIRKKKREKKTLCYDSILLIQLRNGCRISEAVRSFKYYLTTGKLEIKTRVSKKKKPEERLIIIPRELEENNVRKMCGELIDIDDKTLTNRVKVYSIREYKINTHSLRYSFITYLLRQGVNPAIVSKIIKHSKLDQLLTYVQEKTGEELLRKLDLLI